MPFRSHDEYFASQPVESRTRLERIQKEVEMRVPGTTRTVSYNMPAFRRGKIFFYFAAFKKHIGIYPPVTADQALIASLAPFRGPKGNLSFRLDQPMPYELIAHVAEALAAQYCSDGSPPPRST